MADLERFFGGRPFVPVEDEHVDSPETQLRQAMRDAGLTPPDAIEFDGKIHRFGDGSKAKRNDDSGWYIAHGDNIPAGTFGSWRGGVTHNWRANIGRQLTVAEEMALTRRIAELRKIREEETAKRQSQAADTVWSIWNNCDDATADHPYLREKGVQPHGAKITGDGRLVFPLWDENGALISVQYVAFSDGESVKRYHSGARTTGGFSIIGDLNNATQLYLAEGYATAATIHEATGQPCAVSYSAHALVRTAEILRGKLAHLPLTIVADNDRNGVGLKHAEQAAAKFGARYVMPPKENPDASVDANDFAQSGGDLLKLLEPQQSGWLVDFVDFCSDVRPVRWLIKGWLQRGGLAMIHGPSGCGKSFQVLSWSCGIATPEIDDWAGHKMRTGPVVYLAGEGHDGIRARGAAWFAHHGVKPRGMYISQHGCDLDTPEGYCKARDAIRSLPTDEPPVLVVVDTLHRHLAGDENSAQDVKKMLDACGGLQREFGCTVLLVHHTGVSAEAQQRGRGSSAWKGGLEGEFNMYPLEDGVKRIRGLKIKDGGQPEDVHVELREIALDGWLDEDGEQVTSAVLELTDPPIVDNAKKVSKELHLLKRAWFALGAECDHGGKPYVALSALKQWLEDEGESTASVKVNTRETGGGLIAKLVSAGIIAQNEHGYSVVDENSASAMLISRDMGRVQE